MRRERRQRRKKEMREKERESERRERREEREIERERESREERERKRNKEKKTVQSCPGPFTLDLSVAAKAFSDTHSSISVITAVLVVVLQRVESPPALLFTLLQTTAARERKKEKIKKENSVIERRKRKKRKRESEKREKKKRRKKERDCVLLKERVDTKRESVCGCVNVSERVKEPHSDRPRAAYSYPASDNHVQDLLLWSVAAEAFSDTHSSISVITAVLVVVLQPCRVSSCSFVHTVNCRRPQQDFAQFPEKDKTHLVEGGVTLSGGQRARVGLARAVYKDADLYLLDAPFTHLDIVTEKEIFEKCVCKLMASKTRIVVTSKLDHLKRADKILLLHNGDSYFYGTFSELQANARTSAPCSSAWKRTTTSTQNDAAPSSPRRYGESPSTKRPASEAKKTYGSRSGKTTTRSSQTKCRTVERAIRKNQTTTIIEDGVRELNERRFSVVPEDDQVEEVLPRSNMFHHGLHHLKGSAGRPGETRAGPVVFRKKLSITPQCDLASELDIYARRLSKDSVYDISEDVDEQDMEQAFADENESVFETTSWSTYLRYVTTNKSLVYVLGFIFLIFVIEVAGSVIGIYLITDKIWRDGANPNSPNYISEQQPNASSPPVHLAVIVTPTSAYYIIYIYVATSESVLALGFFRGFPWSTRCSPSPNASTSRC
ncbi:hypothetical protein WMY93_023717 [Mugilogobius chulae]|uniref:ABC transporter domain-containing protein n=1 Tax=Mugilogobius chulae TaxID=88201 RepID=A0AAW0NC15_9GOBI